MPSTGREKSTTIHYGKGAGTHPMPEISFNIPLRWDTMSTLGNSVTSTKTLQQAKVMDLFLQSSQHAIFLSSGNELSGDGVSAKVDVAEYSHDLIVLKEIIDDLYQDKKPMILAPGGFFDQEWFADMLQISGTDVINGVTHHIYNLGPGQWKFLLLFSFSSFILL